MDVIQGRNLNKAKAYIALDAYIIIGTHNESLYAMLNGEIKNCTVVEGPNSATTWGHAIINDDTALLIFKTELPKGKRERYHTILVTRTPGRAWKIRNWHVSN